MSTPPAPARRGGLDVVSSCRTRWSRRCRGYPGAPTACLPAPRPRRFDAQREHLEAWDAAGRPTLEEIHRANGLGRLTQVEAAAVRSIRAGEAFEAIGFTPEEVATMRRNAFLDVLARGVDAGLGEPEPPPVEPKPAPKPRRKAKAR